MVVNKVFSKKDRGKGFIEVYILEHNNQVSEDLIWLHMKGKEEGGFCMTTGEAVLIAEGLLKAVNKLKTYEFPS